VLYNYFLSFIILMNLYRFLSFNSSSCGREIGLILRSNFKRAWHIGKELIHLIGMNSLKSLRYEIIHLYFNFRHNYVLMK
jgi:hypothetical protein